MITDTDIKDKNNSLIKKRCVTVIPELENDQTCAARALSDCIAQLNNDPNLKQLQRQNRAHRLGPNSQKGKALELIKMTTV